MHGGDRSSSASTTRSSSALLRGEGKVGHRLKVMMRVSGKGGRQKGEAERPRKGRGQVR